MSSHRLPQPIQMGLVSDWPMRLEGLVSIFGHRAAEGKPQLIPIPGALNDMLNRPTLEYLVVDIHEAAGGLALIDSIRHIRPSLKLIVIGPEGNDELVMEVITAGARAYLDQLADAAMVRQAVDVVISGSIWAPRRLLSKLIDRLLRVPDSALTNCNGPHLTDREKQVLELILTAKSNREIANKLGIEERTVKSHVGRLMRKTGVDNRIELTMRALNRTLVPDNHPDRRPDRPQSALMHSEQGHVHPQHDQQSLASHGPGHLV